MIDTKWKKPSGNYLMGLLEKVLEIQLQELKERRKQLNEMGKSKYKFGLTRRNNRNG